MSNHEPAPGRDSRSDPDPHSAALVQAFGGPKAPHPLPSALRALEARTSKKLGVHLDSHGPSDAPVKVTEEVKALRDPSGRYQMLGEIGRGGVGIVYKGRDQDLGRDVAMKVLKDEYAARSDVLARFVEEAQIGGQLQHPGIVPVYELGLHAGERPYFAMKLVKGETLAAQLAKRSDATQERRRFLGIFEQICQTMAYAHARRVVHRDLKPANVMIGAFGEVQVVDWGFAKVLQRGAADEAAAAPQHASERSVIETVRSRADSGSHSVVGSMLGTPAYMPPEQALGDIDRVDERSDVFSLGAILCEILTGEPPYRVEDGDLVRQAANAQLDGAHERLARCGADEVLIDLSKECLSASQRARPASAAELAERVGRHLTSVEDRAREARVRAAEARLRHRVTLWSAAAGLLVLALGAGSWIWIEDQARSRRSAAGQRVASAMNAASGDQGRAQAARLDLSLWSKARTSAGQLVALARSEEIDENARGAAEALFAAITLESNAAQDEADRRDRDRQMLMELEVARMPTDEDVRKNVSKELWRLDQAYAEVFGNYVGASLLEQPAEATLALLRRGDVAVELAAALDHWGLVRDALRAEPEAPDTAGTARIRELAVLLDGGDAWRNRLRALLPNAAGEGEQLRALAAEANAAAISGVGCRVLGQALWSAGEREAAVAVLRRGQEQHPTDFDLCFHLALALDLLDPPRLQESLATYRIAHAIRPEHGEVLHRQLLALALLDQRTDEERLARLWVARDPANAHALMHVGYALRGRGQVEEAVACYRRALSIDPDHASAYDALGNVFDEQGRLDEAMACRRMGVAQHPESAHFRTSLGFTLAKQGKLDEAIASYRQALELDPQLVRAHSLLGRSLADQGKLDEAIASHRRAVELDPQCAPAHFYFAKALGQRGELDEAIAHLRKATLLDPKDADAHGYLGLAFEQQGQTDAAITSYRNALELKPHDAAVHHALGLALAKQGRLEEAVACYRRAIEVDPKIVPAHGNLGSALQRLGHLDEAIACYRKVIELDAKDARAHQRLGIALANQGELDEAIACYREAIELNPRDAVIHYSLAVSLSERGDTDEAIASYRRTLELEPKTARAHNNLGTLLSSRNEMDEALLCFRRAVEIDPEYAAAHVNLGLTLREFGALDEALRSLLKAEERFAEDPSPFGRQWHSFSRAQAAEVEAMIARLDAVLTGEVRTASAQEWEGAVRSGHRRERHREVVRLVESTLRDDPELVQDVGGLHDAAGSAALLAANATLDLSAEVRSRSRNLAQTWLRRTLDSWIDRRDRGVESLDTVRGRLSSFLSDADFASVRGESIEALPEDERAGWRDLWQRITEEAAR